MDLQTQTRIVRIKRKRTDEPLDALVIESKSRRKKTRGASGFFQFAETVETADFWDDPELTKDLKTRLSKLASDPVVPSNVETRATPYESPARRYTILKPTIPEVVSEQNLPISKSSSDNLAMYDAVLETSKGKNIDEEPIDPEMEKFIPMLTEYLRLSDQPANIISNSSNSAGTEYVWDVFYHRPVTNDWSMPANVATISGVPMFGTDDSDSASDSPGDEDDEDSNTEDFYRNDYPDEDEDSDHHLSDSDEGYPELDDEEDEEEADFYAFIRSRGRGPQRF